MAKTHEVIKGVYLPTQRAHVIRRSVKLTSLQPVQVNAHVVGQGAPMDAKHELGCHAGDKRRGRRTVNPTVAQPALVAGAPP